MEVTPFMHCSRTRKTQGTTGQQPTENEEMALVHFYSRISSGSTLELYAHPKSKGVKGHFQPVYVTDTVDEGGLWAGTALGL